MFASQGLRSYYAGSIWLTTRHFRKQPRRWNASPRHAGTNLSSDEENMKRLLLSLGLIASLVFVFACERKGGPGTNDDTGPIVIGYYGDLTGRTSNFGQSTKNGVEMAADEINKAGGINGRQVKILSE